jgi:hypothetical protein
MQTGELTIWCIFNSIDKGSVVQTIPAFSKAIVIDEL